MSEKNKTNGILAIFTKEYKYEGLLLLFLSLVAIVLGSMVLIGESTEGANGLTINENVFLIGDYPSAFAWILIILGVASFILAVWPFFKPSVSEIKRVSWPTKGTLLKNTSTVFAFIVILAIIFLFYDFLLGYLLQFFEWLATKFTL